MIDWCLTPTLAIFQLYQVFFKLSIFYSTSTRKQIIFISHFNENFKFHSIQTPTAKK
jgi:hypothetical protein